jgi:hypothetical protein
MRIWIKILFALVVLSRSAQAQGFVNLDFESANVSGYSPGDSSVPIANAFPGWTAIFASSLNTNTPSLVGYDVISLGGPAISINDSKSIFAPIQGSYSALLFGGGSNPLYSSTISQTGLVPVGTQSLLFDAYVSGASFVVTLGGQNINMIPLEAFANYTLYGGNIPSNMAGQVETLSFTEPPATGTQPSMFELDDIQFSPSPIPEPDILGLSALGGVFLGFCRWRSRK